MCFCLFLFCHYRVECIVVARFARRLAKGSVARSLVGDSGRSFAPRFGTARGPRGSEGLRWVGEGGPVAGEWFRGGAPPPVYPTRGSEAGPPPWPSRRASGRQGLVRTGTQGTRGRGATTARTGARTGAGATGAGSGAWTTYTCAGRATPGTPRRPPRVRRPLARRRRPWGTGVPLSSPRGTDA